MNETLRQKLQKRVEEVLSSCMNTKNIRLEISMSNPLFTLDELDDDQLLKLFEKAIEQSIFDNYDTDYYD